MALWGYRAWEYQNLHGEVFTIRSPTGYSIQGRGAPTEYPAIQGGSLRHIFQAGFSPNSAICANAGNEMTTELLTSGKKHNTEEASSQAFKE